MLASPFPPENHPIVFAGIGSMGNSDIAYTLPKLVTAIKEILKEHKNEKGIIHCLDENSFVTMSNNEKIKIKDVIPGSFVKSWNEKTAIFEDQKVLDVIDQGIKECIELSFSDESSIICTENHLILTKNRGWIFAKYIDENDDIMRMNDTYRHEKE